MEIVNPDDMQRPIVQLLKIIPWISVDTTYFKTFLNALVEEKMHIVDELKEMLSTTVISGSLTHRLRDLASKGGSIINSLANDSAKFQFLPNAAVKYLKSADD